MREGIDITGLLPVQAVPKGRRGRPKRNPLSNVTNRATPAPGAWILFPVLHFAPGLAKWHVGTMDGPGGAVVATLLRALCQFLSSRGEILPRACLVVIGVELMAGY